MELKVSKFAPLKFVKRKLLTDRAFYSCETWVYMALCSQTMYHWKSSLDRVRHSMNLKMKTKSFRQNFHSIDSPYLMAVMINDDDLTVEEFY